jgi:hypothetical protein
MKTSADEAIVRAGDFAERVRRNQQQLGAERTSLADGARHHALIGTRYLAEDSGCVCSLDRCPTPAKPRTAPSESLIKDPEDLVAQADAARQCCTPAADSADKTVPSTHRNEERI